LAHWGITSGDGVAQPQPNYVLPPSGSAPSWTACLIRPLLPGTEKYDASVRHAGQDASLPRPCDCRCLPTPNFCRGGRASQHEVLDALADSWQKVQRQRRDVVGQDKSAVGVKRGLLLAQSRACEVFVLTERQGQTGLGTKERSEHRPGHKQ
jgi:hypothetical protein